mmetsp:Transcript_17695/g.27748  ORF Transcript_17695/g.27748 Transcript_17695/m.27748 type:complete len:269 (+) Transcript_17695:1487-2293(+)
MRFKLRVGKQWHSHQHTLFGGKINKFLQRTQRLFKLLPRKTKTYRIHFRRNIRSTWFTSQKSTLTKEISRSKNLINKLTISKPNIMNFHTSLLDNIKYLSHITLINNLIPLIKIQSRQSIRNLDQHGIILQIRQKLDLPQHLQHILLLTRIRIGQHVSKGPLIDTPQFTIRIGQTGRGTRTIVQQCQFTKGSSTRALSDVIPIHGECDIALLHDIEVVTNVSLVDNDRSRRGTIGLHGINQLQPLLFGQTGKDEIVREGIIDEADGLG